jgi:hypothetical protein
MEYKCNKCDKSFKSENRLATHNFKKISCDAVFICNKCDKSFKSHFHLKRHLDRITPCVITPISGIQDKKLLNDSSEFNCQHCNKSFAYASSKKRHLITCVKKRENDEEKETLKLKLKVLEAQLELKNGNTTYNNTNNTDNSTNNTNTNNNNITINVQSMDDLRTFGNENFDYIDTEWLVRCIENNANPKAAYKDLAEHVFFNVDHPENHNMRILDKVGPTKVIVHYNKGKWDMMDIGQALGMAGDNLRNVFQGRDGKWQGKDSAGEILYNKYEFDHPIAKRATDVICNHTEDKFKVLDGIEDTMRDRKEVVSQTHSQLPKKDRPENVYKKMQHDKEEWNQYHGRYTQTYSGEPEDDTPLEDFESDDELFEQAHNDKERELFNNRVENIED